MGRICGEAYRLVDAAAGYYAACSRIMWRGPVCRALQVFEAVWRVGGGEVVFSAERLGLGERHVPFLIRLQQRLGPAADWEDAVVEALLLVDEAARRQMARLLR
ncbi:MAG: hypothetical protein ACP5J3_12425 [Pyrobaculum sp.]